MFQPIMQSHMSASMYSVTIPQSCDSVVTCNKMNAHVPLYHVTGHLIVFNDKDLGGKMGKNTASMLERLWDHFIT